MDWHTVRSDAGGVGVIFTAGASIDRSDIPIICRSVRSSIELTSAQWVAFDMAALAHTDVVVVEALARLHMTLRRAGCDLRLRNVRPHLKDLVRFVGIEDVLPALGEDL